MPDPKFLKYFRLNKLATQFVINSVIPYLEEAKRSTAIPNYLKVLCTLYFLGHGSYQLNVGGGAFIGMSQPSVSRCISLTCTIINRVLLNNCIKFPRDQISIEHNKNMFLETYGFPDTLGAIDCTHIAIIAPPLEHPVYPALPYYNRKRFYSINVQIITDPELKIINMNARYPGSVHDSAIWMTSNINMYLRNEYVHGTLNYHLIGDEGYPLSPWLMVQYPGDHNENSPEGRFNHHLQRARVVIEQLNGILKGRFRCLLKHRTLHYNPRKAADIIYSCGVLHNVARYFNVDMPHGDEYIHEPLQDVNDDHNDGVLNNFFFQGSRKRGRLTNLYFNVN